MIKNKLNIPIIALLYLLVISCTSDLTYKEDNNRRGHSITAEIDNYLSPDTRAIRDDRDDHWTLTYFESGDQVGFYSKFGNVDAEDGNGSFLNVPMDFANNSFYNNDIHTNPNNFVNDSIFYYYPYHRNINYDPSITNCAQNPDYGLELRIKDDDGIEKCRDMLWNYQSSSNTQRFQHSFSSIVILRGEGFKEAKDKSVKIVLNKGFSHVTVATNPFSGHTYAKVLQLVYLEGYGKKEEECRTWEAWKGDDYLVDKQNDPYDGMTFEDAYYVVLPTMYSTFRTTVDYIELNDDNDTPHKITNFVLYSNTKNMHPGQRYPIVIKMKELEPVVHPIGIESWADDEMIKEKRVAGITDAQEFIKWRLAYSQYLENNRSSGLESSLETYGDKVIEAEGGSVKWIFHINADIDFSQYISDYTGIRNILDELEDTLDGNNHTLTGIEISSEESPSFIGKLAESGIIRNLNIRGLRLSYKGSDDNIVVGGLVSSCYGTVSNCDIDGVISTKGPVGMVAGTASNATIEGCNLSGLLLGSSTFVNSGSTFDNKGICGRIENPSSIKSNNCSGLIFQSIN